MSRRHGRGGRDGEGCRTRAGRPCLSAGHQRSLLEAAHRRAYPPADPPPVTRVRWPDWPGWSGCLAATGTCPSRDVPPERFAGAHAEGAAPLLAPGAAAGDPELATPAPAPPPTRPSVPPPPPGPAPLPIPAPQVPGRPARARGINIVGFGGR